MLVSLLKFSRNWQRSPSNVWQELPVQILLWRLCKFSLLGVLLQLWAVPLAVPWYIAGPAELSLHLPVQLEAPCQLFCACTVSPSVFATRSVGSTE